MSAALHTPGPLQIQNGTDIFGPMGGVSAAGVVADENDAWHVADCNVGIAFVNGELRELAWSEKQANARRLVLCWSAHDGLVAALTSARKLLERCGPHLRDIEPECCGNYEPGDGGEYMGQREVVPVCCDQPIDLSDHVANELGAIDAALRAATGGQA